ncbi:MAG: adenosine deaminase [Dinoroseobacter sp.]|jgi:adenosine deaminase
MTFFADQKTLFSKKALSLAAILIGSLLFVAGAALARSSLDLTAQAFEEAKGSRPELVHFLQGFPKGADLHNHLDGSVFSEHALYSATQKGLNYDLVTNSFTTADLSDSVISLDALKQSSDHFRAFREAFSIRSWKQVSGSGRDQFFGVFGRIASSQISEGTMLRNSVRQANAQNIQHLELIAPVVPADVQDKFNAALVNFDINDLESAYTQVADLIGQESVNTSIKTRIDGWEAEGFVDVKNQPDSASVRYIGYIIRVIGLRDFFIATVSNLAAVNADDRVVSLTLVVPEDLPAAIADFDNQMKIIDFLWQKMGQPNLSLHAGELNLEDATLDVMKDRIRKSIDLGHSRRIGHGVSIAWENNAADLLTQMANNKTLVEICLTSNEAILDIQGRDHPFDLYRKYKVPMSLNTDDEGVSRSPLTLEFVKAVERYNLSYADVLELARNSLEYSFLSGDSLFDAGDFSKPIASFKRYDFVDGETSSEQQLLLTNNPKLQTQVKFERDLAAFETKFISRGR